MFAGFLRCGDCGRAMCKTNSKGGVYYSCGSYKRYGASVCTPHTIPQIMLEEVVLQDVNQLLVECSELQQIVESVLGEQNQKRDVTEERKNLQHRIAERERRKKKCYEDYCDELLSKEEFLTYKKEYEGELRSLKKQLEQLCAPEEEKKTNPWIETLTQQKRLAVLDRGTVQAVLSQIVVYAENRVEIHYAFEGG